MTSPPRSILRREHGVEEAGSTRKCVQFAHTENSTPRFSNGAEERLFAKSIVAPPDEEDWNLPFKPMAELRSEEDDVIEISPPQNLEIDIGDFLPSNWSTADGAKGLESFRSLDSLSSAGLRAEKSSSLASISSDHRSNDRNLASTASPPEETSETMTLDTFRPDVSSQGASGVVAKTSESTIGPDADESENAAPDNHRSPPRWSVSNKVDVLEMPSPTPLRPSILGTHQGGPRRTEVDIGPTDFFQGLDDFLAVVGQQELFDEIQSAGQALKRHTAPSVAEMLETHGWNFVLDTMFDVNTDSADNPLLTDERLLGDLVGNMAYLTALELNDSRCERYSQKLAASIQKHSFDKLSYKVDLWTLNCENRSVAVDRINQLVRAKRSLARHASGAMWDNEFLADTKMNIMRMTLMYLKRMMETLKEYSSFLQSKQTELDSVSGLIEAERLKKQTHDQIVDKWKYTIEHYRERKRESLGREELVRKKLAVWTSELHALKAKKDREAQALESERIKRQKVTNCLIKLNLMREASLFVQDWTPLDIAVDTKTNSLKLVFNTGINHLRCSNPYAVIDPLLWPTEERPASEVTQTLRKQILKAGSTSKPLIDAIMLSLAPWTAVVKLKKAAVEHLMLGDLMIQPVTVNAVTQQLLSQDAAHKSPTLLESVACLYVSLLCALGCCATDIMLKAISPECKSVDLIGGIIWGLLCNAEKIGMEIMGLWWEHSAYKRVNGCLVVHNAQHAPSPEVLGVMEPSTKFNVNVYRSEGVWTAVIRVPLACKSGIDVLVMEFDLMTAVKSGSLAQGYRGLHGLQTIGNALKTELKKRVRENTHKSTLTTFAHGCGVRDAVQALMPLLAKR